MSTKATKLYLQANITGQNKQNELYLFTEIMSIQIRGLYCLCLFIGEKNNIAPDIQPAKVKLTTLIIAEGSMAEPFIKKPIVRRAVTMTAAVIRAV